MFGLPLRRALALIASAFLLLTSLAALSATPATAAGVPVRAAGTGIEKTCLQDILGGAQSPAATAGVPAAVTSEFSIFSRAATATDAYNGPGTLAGLLADNRVSAYDLSGVRLLESDSSGDDVYIVPVTLRPASVPAECASVTQLKGYQAELNLDRAVTGSGTGVCVISTYAASENGQASHQVDGVECESLTVLHTWFGALGLEVVLGDPAGDTATTAPQSGAVVPDGVSSVTETYRDGHQVIDTVTANLATADSDDDSISSSGNPTLRTELEDELPTEIQELGSSGQSIASYTEPADAITLYLAADAWEQKLAGSSGDQGIQVTAGGQGTTPTIHAACTAAGACQSTFITKKCGAKKCQVTTTKTVCSTQHVCHSTSVTKLEPKSEADKPGSGSYSSSGPDLRSRRRVIARAAVARLP